VTGDREAHGWRKPSGGGYSAQGERVKGPPPTAPGAASPALAGDREALRDAVATVLHEEKCGCEPRDAGWVVDHWTAYRGIADAVLSLPEVADALAQEERLTREVFNLQDDLADVKTERDAVRADALALAQRVEALPDAPGCVGTDDNDVWRQYVAGWSAAMQVVRRAVAGPRVLDLEDAVSDGPDRPARIAAYLGVTEPDLRQALTGENPA
jgi:hypothetical protein